MRFVRAAPLFSPPITRPLSLTRGALRAVVRLAAQQRLLRSAPAALAHAQVQLRAACAEGAASTTPMLAALQRAQRCLEVPRRRTVLPLARAKPLRACSCGSRAQQAPPRASLVPAESARLATALGDAAAAPALDAIARAGSVAFEGGAPCSLRDVHVRGRHVLRRWKSSVGGATVRACGCAQVRPARRPRPRWCVPQRRSWWWPCGRPRTTAARP